jgi:transglutaminase-like putative cysteine protease
MRTPVSGGSAPRPPAEPSTFVRRTLRALFPPADLRRLSFRGGWFALPLYLVMISMYPLSLQHADWVDTSGHFWWLALLGVAFGTIVGNGKLRARRAILTGGLVGMLLVMVSTVAAAPGGGLFRDRLVHLAILVNNWITQVLAGEAANDPTVFVLFLGSTVWAATFMGSLTLARAGRIWDAVLFNGGCLVVNVSVALTNLYPDLVVFTLAVLVLLVRIHIVNLQERWARQNIVPSGEMDWRLLRGGLTWTTVLVVLSLVSATQRVGAAEVLNGAWSTFESPYHRVEAEWQRFFAGVSGPSRLRGVSFSDSIRLGQAPNLGDRVVFTVEAGAAHFWRAVTYDFYTGAGWRTTETDKADKIAVPTTDRQKFDARFDIVAPHANLLFAASEPVRADVPYQFQSGADRTYSTSLRALNRAQAQGSYTVTSFISIADKQTLRRLAPTYSDYIRAKYLQLPSTLPQRVKDLAHKVAGELPNAYDKAEAIESYLRSVYRYSSNVRATPAGRDPVDYFLFDLKEDFCEYFASSMVVMLRELGVPARIVEGFTTGTYDSGLDRYVVKEIDAHAWVEVYFPQYGWIEFEPTPSQAPFARVDSDIIGSAGGEGGDLSAGAGREDAGGLGQNELDRGVDDTDLSGGDPIALVRQIDPRPAIGFLALCVLLLALAVANFNWRFRGLGPVESAWGKTRLLASYVGHPADPSQTTYEYASSLGATFPETSDPVKTLADVRVRQRYAPGGIDEDAQEAAVTAWHQAAGPLLALLPGRVLRSFTRSIR